MAWRSLPPGVYRGFRESYKAEIAAYELDKLLKMDMVPPSVERQLEGNTVRPNCGWRTSSTQGRRIAGRIESGGLGEPAGADDDVR